MCQELASFMLKRLLKVKHYYYCFLLVPAFSVIPPVKHSPQIRLTLLPIIQQRHTLLLPREIFALKNTPPRRDPFMMKPKHGGVSVLWAPERLLNILEQRSKMVRLFLQGTRSEVNTVTQCVLSKPLSILQYLILLNKN